MIKSLLRKTVRALGYDVTTFPAGSRRIEAHLSMLLARLGIDCVLDVGANRGQFGSLLRGIGYAGPIVSFEPVTACFQQLRHAARNDPLWDTRQLALGECNGTLPIHVTASTDFSSFLVPNEYCRATFGDGPVQTATEDVRVRRLDEMLDEEPRACRATRIFLKMDTQGYDHQVLSGAAGWLDRIIAVQSELSVRPIYEGAPRYLDALRWFEAAGYELSGLFTVNRDRELRVVEMDCVMVRRHVCDDQVDTDTPAELVSRHSPDVAAHESPCPT
jgi:FkbM family methyltransferase